MGWGRGQFPIPYLNEEEKDAFCIEEAKIYIKEKTT